MLYHPGQAVQNRSLNSVSQSQYPLVMRSSSRFLLLITALLLSACGQIPYQAIEPGTPGLHSGYLDKEVSPGVHVIEVRHSHRYSLSQEQDLVLMKSHWQRRAAELCLHGYRGEPDVRLPADARLSEFQCSPSSCPQTPLVSGIVWCHQRYQL